MLTPQNFKSRLRSALLAAFPLEAQKPLPLSPGELDALFKSLVEESLEERDEVADAMWMDIQQKALEMVKEKRQRLAVKGR